MKAALSSSWSHNNNKSIKEKNADVIKSSHLYCKHCTELNKLECDSLWCIISMARATQWDAFLCVVSRTLQY